MKIDLEFSQPQTAQAHVHVEEKAPLRTVVAAVEEAVLEFKPTPGPASIFLSKPNEQPTTEPDTPGTPPVEPVAGSTNNVGWSTKKLRKQGRAR